MTPFEIIPAIDLLDGQVVRLTQGDYQKVETYQQLSPSEWAKRFTDFGAKRIHIVDLNGAKEGKLANAKAIESIRKATSCKLELGGGVRDFSTVNSLIELGVDWVILGSLLIKNIELSHDLIHAFPQRIIAGLDAKGSDIAIEGWLESSGTSIFSMIETLNNWPIASIIYTDISKDGMLTGPNIDALTQVAHASGHPIIASGGVGTTAHIESVRQLSDKGISGIIVGKALLSGAIDSESIRF
jgi:phosphoribosylformimino-5-aminoimidazole carboxamide ribotide isomerase